jgi:hypothetical protein
VQEFRVLNIVRKVPHARESCGSASMTICHASPCTSSRVVEKR